VNVDLSQYQKALSSGGLSAVQNLPGFFADLAQMVPESPAEAGNHFESLAFDALTLGHAGWAAVCMGAAHEQFQRADRTEDIQRCVQQNLLILAEGFPPFENQADLLDAIRVWVQLRLEFLGSEESKLTAQGSQVLSPFHPSVLARHRWWFSLLRTRHLAQKFKCDSVFDAYGVNVAERIIVWTASAVCGKSSGGIRAGLLIAILGGDESEKASNLALLKVGGPLRQSGLVWMIPNGPDPGPIQEWWLRPNPEFQDFLCFDKELSSAWPMPTVLNGRPDKGQVQRWARNLKDVGLIPPVDLDSAADILPDETQLMRQVCEQLSIEVWTQGQPGKPLPLEQLRKALDSYSGS
jgi:hypothetical protein